VNRLLIRSDHISIRSDGYSASVSNRSTQTPSQLGARSAPDRAAVAWFADRDLQALRSAKLPLRQWSGARSEAISRDQSARRAAAQRLRPECHAQACCQFDRQLQRAVRRTLRDLCDQHGTPAPAGGSRVNLDGSSPHHLRCRKGGRGARRYGRLLSRRWRLTSRSGERQ
jgi:hypothetical protein